jgi:hypothetical protein
MTCWRRSERARANTAVVALVCASMATFMLFAAATRALALAGAAIIASRPMCVAPDVFVRVGGWGCDLSSEPYMFVAVAPWCANMSQWTLSGAGEAASF